MKPTEQIQIYANNIMVDGQRDDMRITLTGIDVDQIISEFSTEELYNSIVHAGGFEKLERLMEEHRMEDEE